MKCYKLRCTLKDASSDSVLTCVNTFADVSAYVLEGMMTDNPHVHFYVETDLASRTIRSRLRTLLGKGNGKYSLKETEQFPIAYLAYLLKEGEVSYINVPQSVIEESQRYDAQVKLEMKKKKDEKKSFLLTLESYVKSVVDPDNFDFHTIAEAILEYYISKDKLINVRLIEQYSTTILLRSDPERLELKHVMQEISRLHNTNPF